MPNWNYAQRSELKLLEKICILLEQDSSLIRFLFDPDKPRLRRPVDELLFDARGLSSGEFILIKLSIDLWCGEGGCLVSELFDYEDVIMPRLFKALG